MTHRQTTTFLPLEAVHFTCIFFLMNNNKFCFLLYTSSYAEYSIRTTLLVLDTPHNEIKKGYPTIFISVIHHSHKLFTTLKTMVHKYRLYYKLFKQSLQ